MFVLLEDTQSSTVAIKSTCLQALYSWDDGSLANSRDFVDFVSCLSFSF